MFKIFEAPPFFCRKNKDFLLLFFTPLLLKKKRGRQEVIHPFTVKTRVYCCKVSHSGKMEDILISIVLPPPFIEKTRTYVCLINPFKRKNENVLLPYSPFQSTFTEKENKLKKNSIFLKSEYLFLFTLSNVRFCF